jgi:hypothetical protein
MFLIVQSDRRRLPGSRRLWTRYDPLCLPSGTTEKEEEFYLVNVCFRLNSNQDPSGRRKFTSYLVTAHPCTPKGVDVSQALVVFGQGRIPFVLSFAWETLQKKNHWVAL